MLRPFSYILPERVGMDKLRSELSAHVMEYFVVEVHVVSQHASEHYLYYIAIYEDIHTKYL